jgi:hypothetical protein
MSYSGGGAGLPTCEIPQKIKEAQYSWKNSHCLEKAAPNLVYFSHSVPLMMVSSQANMMFLIETQQILMQKLPGSSFCSTFSIQL